MKRIRPRYISIALLAFCLLASFTRPLKSNKDIVNGKGITEIQNLNLYPAPVPAIEQIKPFAVSETGNIQPLSAGTTVFADVVSPDMNTELTDEASDETRIGQGVIALTPLPVKPLPVSKAKKLADIKVVTLPDGNTLEKEYYKYDSVAHAFKKIESNEKTLGLDPVRFSIRSSKDSINAGEEVEIRISAEFLDINPRLMFQFEGSNAFTLKMLMPKGFIQTGGTYYDYIQGKVTKEQPRQEFVIKGFFESISETEEFKLLRAGAHADINSQYYLAEKLQVFARNGAIAKTEPKTLLTDLTFKKILKGLSPTSYLLDCSTVSISFSHDPPCYNVTFTVSVSGCYGSVTWARNYQWNTPLIYTGTSFQTNELGVYQAQCQNSCGYAQTATKTTNGQYANNISIDNATIDCGQSTATLTVNGCNGYIEWNTGETTLSITKGAGSYSAKCNQSCNFTTATAFISSPPPYPNTPSLSTNKTLLCYNESAQLSVGSCDNGSQLQWVNQPGNTNAVGPGTYKVRCFNSCYQSPYSEVTIIRDNSTPAAPVISGPTSLCPDYVVSMNVVSGCSAGSTFHWKDGDSYVSHADAVLNGGSYTINAWCTNTCSNNTAYSNSITVSAKYPGSTPTISANTYAVCGDNQATLSASGCNGTVYWYSFAFGFKGTGPNISVRPDTYYARCENECGQGNQSNNITITQAGYYANNITVTPSYTNVCNNASDVALTVNNCNGYVSWSDWQAEGQTVRYNMGPGTYTAFCNTSCSTTQATATINNLGSTPAAPTLTQNRTYLCGSEQATIFAAYCDGTVFWNDNVNWTGQSITVGAGSYFAKCMTACGTSGASETKYVYNASPISITSSYLNYQNGTSCGATYADIGVFSSTDPNGTNYNYVWDNGLGNGRGKRVYGSGTYSVYVWAEGMCPATYTITVNFITKPPAPTLTASSNPACQGSTVSISSSCSGTTSFSTAVPFTMGSSPVSVYASCTANGCTSDNSAPITINPIPIQTAKPVITASGGFIICSANGSIPLSVTCDNGSAPVWSNSATTSTINVSTPGNYSVVCKNSCGQSSPVSDVKAVTKDPTTVPNIAAANNKTSVCGSEMATLNATNCTGTISWSNGATGPSINVGVGTYSARCTTTCGTSSYSSSITVTTPAAPSIPTLEVTTLKICSFDGNATLTASCTSGEPIWWDDARTTTKVVNNAGTYSVQCINACNARSTVVSKVITKDPTATPTITATTTKICAAETATLTASGCPAGGSVIWSTGATANSIVVSNAGNYTAFCRTTCGDSSPSNQITINKNVPPDTPSISSQGGRLTVCLGANAVLQSTGGCSAASVVWFGNNGTESMTRMNTDGTLTLTNTSFTGASMTFKSICQTSCGTSGESNQITIFKSNFTATASTSSPNGEADEYTNNLSLFGNTSEPNVSYAWVGPNGFNSNQKDPVILSEILSANYSGIYTVTVTNTGGCYATATTSVLIDVVALDCNAYYVKSYYSSPTEEETNKLRRIGTTNAFEPISMTLYVIDGTTTAGMNYQWTAPSGITLSPGTNAPVVTATKIGHYKLTITRGASTCEVETDISGMPCNEIPAGGFVCTDPFTFNPAVVSNQVPNLAVGDEFYAADYKFQITRIDEGSLTDGWTGEAIGTLRVVNGFEVKLVPVEFTKIAIDECYRFVGTTATSTPTNFTGIRTKYDPEWKNFVDVSKIIEDLGNLIDNIKNWADKFTNVQVDKDLALKYVEELKVLKQEITDDVDYSATDIATINGFIDEEITLLESYTAPNGGARVSSNYAAYASSVKTGAARMEASIWTPLLNWLCDQNSTAPYDPDGTGPEKAGIVPKCIWQDANWFVQDKAFGCGLIDGFYVNISDKVGNFIDFVNCVKSIVQSAVNPDTDLKACRAVGEQLFGPIKMIYGVMTNSETRNQAWEGIKQEAKKYGQILTCTGAYSDARLCRYMQGRLIGDFVADYATGAAALKLVDGVKKVAKVTNFTKALETIEKVENGFAQLSQSVDKLGNAALKKVGTGSGMVAKLVVDGTVEVARYTGATKTFESLVGWTTDASAKVKARLRGIKYVKDGNTYTGDIDICEVCTTSSFAGPGNNLRTNALAAGCQLKTIVRQTVLDVLRRKYGFDDLKKLNGVPAKKKITYDDIKSKGDFYEPDDQSLRNIVQDIKSKGDQSGAKTELLARKTFDGEGGFKAIPENKTKIGGNNGFDLCLLKSNDPNIDLNTLIKDTPMTPAEIQNVVNKIDKIHISECKQTSIKLSESGVGIQMSPLWIDDVILRMTSNGQSNIASKNLGLILREKFRTDNKSSLTKSVFGVYKTSNPPVVCVVKIL